MSVLSGIATMVEARSAKRTQGLTTLGNIASTGISTAFGAVGALVGGDISGAASALVKGAGEQVGNVASHVASPVTNTLKEWRGVGEVISGVTGLFGGEPEKAGRRA